MTHKTMLLALSAICAAMFALPATSSAAGWNIDPAGVSFTSISGVATLNPTSGLSVTCEASTGSGAYNAGSQATGTVEITLTGCHSGGTNNCTTTGKENGEITTQQMVFHNVVLENTTQNNPPKLGLLLTPKNGLFASFTCTVLGIDNPILVEGTGIIGEIAKPTCGTASTTAELVFAESSKGVQKWMQEETTGTKFDLTQRTNGGAAVTAGETGTGTVTFASSATATCP